MIERRRSKRFYLNLCVGSSEITGKVLDFSRRGMKIILDTSRFEGSEIDLFIERPDYNYRVPVSAWVVWARQDGAGCLLGLKFKKISNKDRADFLKYGYKVWLNNKKT